MTPNDNEFSDLEAKNQSLNNTNPSAIQQYY
jgi:hypothetical protein